MTTRLFLTAAMLSMLLSACADKGEQATNAATNFTDTHAPSSVATSSVSTAVVDGSPEALEMAKKLAALDYATMEDGYLSDPKGQWASDATASASYGTDQGSADRPGFGTSRAATGKPDDIAWLNKDAIGITWLKVDFAVPTTAAELRVVIKEGFGAISKIELIDVDGNAHAIVSGVDSTKKDERGPRTWYVTKFENTTYVVKAAKISVAPAMNGGNPVYIEAVQLVGS